MTEADTGVRQLRAKECQGSIATMRSQEEAKKVSTQRKDGLTDTLILDY